MPEPIEHHWFENARHVKTTNWDSRPVAEDVSLIVIHCISLPAGHFGGPYIEHLFCNRLDCLAHTDFADLVGLRVSAHVLIRRDGELVQFVALDRRAWHAGQSAYGARSGCNDYSIGIELEGTDETPFTSAQYNRLASVCRSLQSEYNAIGDSITGHSDVAPGRKTDPGSAFDWPRLWALMGELSGVVRS